MRMIELSLTPGAEPPAGVEIEQLLHDLFFAVQTESKSPVSQAYKRSTQGFEFWVSPECEKRVEFAVGNLAVPEDLSGPLQPVHLSQMLKKVGKNNKPHGTFATLHDSPLHLSASRQVTILA
jgi:hypothetical protein